MALFSKSIQERVDVGDGIRICIMRKPDFNASWDIWMPTLAPSLDLFRSYQTNLIDWPGYVTRFTEEVIVGKHDHLKLLVAMAKITNITVLCWEKTAEFCHRRLVVEEAKKIDPTLEICIF